MLCDCSYSWLLSCVSDDLRIQKCINLWLMSSYIEANYLGMLGIHHGLQPAMHVQTRL